MSNLLDLLRAWGESLFIGKRAWASAQAFPSAGARIQIENANEGTYVAPSDGFFGIYVAGTFTFVDLYSTDNTARKTSFQISNGTLSGSGSVPVRKGDIVKWNSDKVPSEIWFLVSAGSE